MSALSIGIVVHAFVVVFYMCLSLFVNVEFGTEIGLMFM